MNLFKKKRKKKRRKRKKAFKTNMKSKNSKLIKYNKTY